MKSLSSPRRYRVGDFSKTVHRVCEYSWEATLHTRHRDRRRRLEGMWIRVARQIHRENWFSPPGITRSRGLFFNGTFPSRTSWTSLIFFSFKLLLYETKISVSKLFLLLTKSAIPRCFRTKNLCKYTVYKYFYPVFGNHAKGKRVKTETIVSGEKKKDQENSQKMKLYMCILSLRGYKSNEKIVATLPDSRIRVS